VLVVVSTMESFQQKYPFYDHATDSLVHFVAYEVAYGIQFFSLEAFFRGFLVFALFKKFGYYAVVIMTVPYCMIHFGKPPAETLGAIVAGLILGYLAVQSRSWIPGAFLHWGVGLTMDVLVVFQTVILPG
jgi:membrane protease YdiL (CAAX protease family)